MSLQRWLMVLLLVAYTGTVTGRSIISTTSDCFPCKGYCNSPQRSAVPKVAVSGQKARVDAAGRAPVPYSSPTFSKNRQIDSMQPQTHTDRWASEAPVSARCSGHPTGANADAEQPMPGCTKDATDIASTLFGARRVDQSWWHGEPAQGGLRAIPRRTIMSRKPMWRDLMG
jgi:hypothetical protein